MFTLKKRCLIFRVLWYLALAINILVYFIFDSIINEFDFKSEAVVLVLVLVTEGIERGYMAISRKDYVVLPTCIGAIIISFAVIGYAFKTVSEICALLILGCLIVQCVVLSAVYVRWFINYEKKLALKRKRK